MDEIISSLAVSAANSTPCSPSTIAGLTTISSWVVAAQLAVNTFNTDTNFATPT